ncbi:hypothetical protein ACFL03_01305 [Thermodesulfobacteriota bacterium]
MNPFSKKIIASFSLVMLGIHIIAVTAGGAALCASQPCCCTKMMMHHNGPPSVIDSIEHGCCSSTATVPCALNKNQMPDTPPLIVSSATEDMKAPVNGTVSVAVNDPSFRLPTIGNKNFNPFWITIDPIPIYLQNQTFIC